jgi:hypothetical protein
LKIPRKEILDAYKAYWKFIRNTIEKLPLKEDLDEIEFSKLRTNFNIPKLGKLHCTYPRYKTLNIKIKENDKHKESKADV